MKFGLAFSNIEPFAGAVPATRLAQAAEEDRLRVGVDGRSRGDPGGVPIGLPL